MGISGGNIWGQARAGAHSQEEGVDGGEFHDFIEVLFAIKSEFLEERVEVELIILLGHGIQLGLDVLGIEPFHKV